MPRWIRWAACLPVLALPRAARAEVLDKVAPPWEPFVLGCTLVALAVTVACALSSKRTLRAAGFAFALLWAVYRIGADEWFSEDVGPHIRIELPAGEARVWLGTILAEGLLPLVVAVGIGVVRRERLIARPTAPPPSARRTASRSSRGRAP